MRKDFGAKPYTYPQPVLMIATYLSLIHILEQI